MNIPWKIQDNKYAIKILDIDILKTREIVISKNLRKFFSIDSVNSDVNRNINVVYLNGNYEFNVRYNKKSDESIIKINDDLYLTLLGFLHSLDRDAGGGNLYLAFYKRSNLDYGLKVGVVG